VIAHWDEARRGRGEAGRIAGEWTGTRSVKDVCHYSRSNKVYFRGLGLIARLEDLDYHDGELA
jgi:hypothetical protein